MKLDNRQTQSQIPMEKEEDGTNQASGEALTMHQLQQHQTVPVSDDQQCQSSLQLRGKEIGDQTETSGAIIKEEKTLFSPETNADPSSNKRLILILEKGKLMTKRLTPN